MMAHVLRLVRNGAVSACLAASVVVTNGAVQAADLGRPAPAAVDYVKVCDAYGAGFFYIPGSQTCLKIGGGVRFDVDYSDKDFYINLAVLANFYDALFGNGFGSRYRALVSQRQWNRITTLARARVDMDARSMTEFGLLRSYLRAEFQVGNYHETVDPVTLFYRSPSVPSTVLREAYLQWGGLTAGLTYSLYNLPYFLTYSNPFTADQRTTMLAYTFASNGFAASLAVEDPTARRGAIGPFSNDDLVNMLAGRSFVSNYGGIKYPDVIGTVKYDGQAFSIQASGAAHHINRAPWTLFAFPTGKAVDEWGYAAQVGANVRVFERGSIYGGLSYTKGASAFSGIGADDDRLGGGIGFAVTDGSNAGGKWVPTEITSAHVGAGYGVTDKVRLAGSFGYAKVTDDYRQVVAGLGILRDYDVYRGLGLIEWTPAENFRIGAELGYTAVDFKDNIKNIFRDYDRITAMMRVERRF